MDISFVGCCMCLDDWIVQRFYGLEYIKMVKSSQEMVVVGNFYDRLLVGFLLW